MRATMDAVSVRSRWADPRTGAACTPGSTVPSARCVQLSLADVGFKDVGLDAGFEDCHARTVGGLPAFHGPSGRPLIDRTKFPRGLADLVEYVNVRVCVPVYEAPSAGRALPWRGTVCIVSRNKVSCTRSMWRLAPALPRRVLFALCRGMDSADCGRGRCGRAAGSGCGSSVGVVSHGRGSHHGGVGGTGGCRCH